MSTTTNLVELIRSGRWRFGLATTYTFSLGFLETAVRPAWREHGSSALWVLSDVKGYRASLAEGETSGAGRDYHLLPVEVQGGVFHPKIMYLGGDERDLLLVSSANLTFAGQCRNLEVGAVVTSDRNPEAFLDLLGFLEVLRRSNSISCPDLTWADLLEKRLRRPRGQGSGGARLLYSPGETLEATLPRLVGTSATKITVLSPFHDKHGDATKRIAAALGTQQYAVGLDPSDASRSPFPFKEHPAAEPALPVLEGEIRPLHAKIIDIEQPDGRWQLIGSFNATITAFLTTSNVEASLLRRVDSGETEFSWIPAPMPEWVGSEAPEPSPSVSPCIHATLDLSGELRGRIIGTRDLSGTWTGHLRFGDGTEHIITATLAEDGRFRTRLPSGVSVFTHSSARLALKQDNISAEGWVHWPQVLARDPITRATVITNLIEQGLSSDDDMLEFLALIGEGWRVRIDSEISSPASTPPSDRIDAPNETPLAPGVLTPDASVPDHSAVSNLPRTGDPSLLLRPLNELLRHLRDAQKKTTEAKSAWKGDDDDEDDDDGSEDSEHHQQRKIAIADALDAFEREMRSAIRAQRRNESGIPSWALAQWFSIGLATRAWKGEGSRACADFAGQWLESARTCAQQPDDTDYIKAVLSAAIGLASAVDRPSRWTLSAIHDCLLDALGEELSGQAITAQLPTEVDPLVRRISGQGEINPAAILTKIFSVPAKRVLLQGMNEFLLRSMTAEKGQHSAQKSAKRAILTAYGAQTTTKASQTFMQILIPSLLKTWRDGEAFSPQEPLDTLYANSPAAQSLFDDLVADRLPRRMACTDASRVKPACPCCSTALLPIATQELKNWGVTRCTGRCSAILIDAQ